MVKISKLLLLGAGAYAVKYYLDNPKKAEEHKEILKEKANNSISYTKCMWNYTKENGIAESAEHLKNDLERVTKENIEKLNNKVNDTVEYGKQLVNDSVAIKDSAFAIKDKGAELTNNLTEATKILKEEITPALNNYINDVKDIVSRISLKSEELKEIVKKDNVEGKIKEYKEDIDSIVVETKEKIEEISREEKSEIA
ncbi:hypothetical protein [Gemella sp. zg-1178]|uniref:hypothetical protein n=1 Tax=Gemella sp. zg-1178 TaxID=2840372 RepID=UPI001C0431BF|nr:hypothetical protein [Gemella sp. zg-1178]MBU0278897.1 hypothetical protein [Gemella sp. zg-1178]